METKHILPLIIYREFLSKISNKSFKVLTFLSPILFIAVGGFIFYMSSLNENSVKKVAILDRNVLNSQELIEDTGNLKFVYLSNIDLESVKIIQDEQQFYGVLSIPEFDLKSNKFKSPLTFYSDESPSLLFMNQLEVIIEEGLKNVRLQNLGIEKEIFNFSETVRIRQQNFSGETSSKFSKELRVGLGMGAGYLIMMFIVIYGTGVMRSVIEEKTSRIIEIVISSVTPFQLMIGKIIGNTLAGLLQFSIWGGFVFLMAVFLSCFFDFDVSAVEIPTNELQVSTQVQTLVQEIFKLPLISMFLFFLLYFIGGFFLYSAIYAAIGAAVDSETDTQQFVMPVILPLILAVYVGFAAVLSDPHGPVAIAFSIIPFTSPIVMLMRIPFGVSVFQLFVSVLLLVTTFIAVVFFAARIYKQGILMYGKKSSYKQLLKWIKN
ncbi:MAG: ABC transporter permease [Flavicella sp.]